MNIFAIEHLTVSAEEIDTLDKIINEKLDLGYDLRGYIFKRGCRFYQALTYTGDKPTPQNVEDKVDAIVNDICDRGGLSSVWDNIDEDTQQEIKDVWMEIIND